MDDERALLKAIIAHPDEDTPRLVFADWLQEHDQPERAEYIRLSIRRANLRYTDPGYQTASQKIAAALLPLIDRWDTQWARQFAARFPKASNVEFVLRRGFIEEIWCSPAFFLKNAERLLNEAPIRSLMPRASTPRTAATLVASSWFRHLTRLILLGVTEALAFLDQPAFDTCEIDCSQFLPGKGWTPVAIRLARHAGLRALRKLNLESCRIGDAGGHALAEAPRLDLELLNLIDNELGEPVRNALRKRYGPRVWLDSEDRNGVPRWGG
jgi:uncharacterized protein (TIGR02996 family)